MSTSTTAMTAPRPQPLSVSPGQSTRPNNHFPDLLGTPPIPPPRTSSTHRSQYSPNSSSRPSKSSRREEKQQQQQQQQQPRDKTIEARDTNSHDRSQRSNPRTSPEQEQGVRSGSAKGASGQMTPVSVGQSRSDVGLEAAALIKESSAIINQMLVSEPVVDIEREHARQASARGSSPPSAVDTDPAAASSSSPPPPPPTSGLAVVGSDGVDDGGRGAGTRSGGRSSSHSKRTGTTFGSYILGQTLGEGEFGKVKLGWKKDGSVQVAIKLIRRESLGSNPGRLPKIYREISILRDLAHPNIVRLHEMVETERHIGIIMEYASGGELFDHILNNRYLKDHAARRLFAQLVSGVGYLHKKGIVHRDLKLENLLLDRNRNIIITDFGFANTFDPADELEEEIEYNLTNKEFVKRMQLDKTNSQGLRRGDLMQTSCGSPCYAAPELVVSDSLYTGRKVDVWSCGVILYAMLAGYLPFDDDPANPDGDNINLLYKYIVTTPLTFPEYVTPHARDLLRRILVPDPRKRADLFEVARHSWLSEYSHVVSHITSSTTKVADIANTTVPSERQDGPSLTRSASVREPPKTYQNPVPTVGGLVHQSGDISQDQLEEKAKTSRDAKRRTVQVEYVAPQSQTTRGETVGAGPESSGTSRARAGSESRGMVEKPLDSVPQSRPHGSHGSSREFDGHGSAATGTTAAPAPGQFPRNTTSDATVPVTQATRPTTGASMASFNTGRLPSRGSYGQPVAPTVAATTAQGRLAQPKSKQYVISPPMPQDPNQFASIGRPSTQQLPAKYNASSDSTTTASTATTSAAKGHKRSNTVSGISEKIFGRSGSIFGSGSRVTPNNGTGSARVKGSKRYPPVSMKDPFTGEETRSSMDSRRSVQYGAGRKQSESGPDRPRRFSLLPPSFSLKGFSSSRSQTPESDHVTQQPRPLESSVRGPPRPATGPARTTTRARATSYGPQDAMGMGMVTEGPSDEVITQMEPVNYQAHIDQQFAVLHGTSTEQGYAGSEFGPQYSNQSSANYYDDYNNNNNNNSMNNNNSNSNTIGPYDSMGRPSMQATRTGGSINNNNNRGAVLQKNTRKFADAYEYERDPSHHSGSSGAARKVMDFFRRRAKSRAGEDR
ncbi:hypothetical protein ASPZODRAFT_489153 [Penicilliopsis zonata CBS 506.65]|uniref:non-specific serine/threonine protein kinase n=1 Tax=Penicilliopsis zonata CBS 506.65 TaxID=1073090 RepID=A0A1L9SER7_9EURO|nr:hypothetical protein ASPZODRAFT_489153 [Penicilliopsis zonata CBS 506.65]OJJ45603.1 hypothetical protein ASPZODRAFT_489153 [Penicilliopsis zonata CBS 506.65]